MRSYTCNFTHEQILEALGDFVIKHRAPHFEGSVHVQASFMATPEELAARVEVTSYPDQQEA